MLTTMVPWEQKTIIYNLIVKDNSFITEMFDKCSFSGIPKGMLEAFNPIKARGH